MTLKQHAKLPASKAHGKDAKGFRAGGKTNLEMKKYGRNMAKVMNQRSPVRKSSGPR
jgi:homogentisate 1,2-dioxygenase